MKPLLMILLLVSTLAARAVTLILPAEATVSADEITLGAVAAIADAGDAEARLAAVVLGQAPPPGQCRVLSAGIVRVRLRQFGFNPDTMTIDGAQSLQITRLAVEVPGDTLLAAAREWLLPRLAPAPGEKLELLPLRQPADVRVPAGEMTLECAPAGLDAGGLRHVMVSIRIAGKTAWSGMVSFRLQRAAEVLIVRAPLARGVLLGADSVTREWRDITQVNGVPLRELDEIAGMRAAVSVSAGAILTRTHVEVMPLVKRNDEVLVRAVCGAMTITTCATALEDGAAGSVIRVRNPDTRLEYRARVTTAGEVTPVR